MKLDYDKTASEYATYRNPDSRIAAQIHEELNDCQLILNIGAGSGAYEPVNRLVTSVEPSRQMIQARLRFRGCEAQAKVEALPFADKSFDCTIAILTMHHWSNLQLGFEEVRRVTRRKLVVFTWVGFPSHIWLEDYFPEIVSADQKLFPSISEIGEYFENPRVEIIQIPSDCTDGFFCAYWQRPGMYLNPAARAAISTFSRVKMPESRLKELQDSLDNGKWHQENHDLLSLKSLDLGYRLITCNIN